MENVLLICGLLAAGMWGFSLMKKIDTFLQGNEVNEEVKSAIILGESTTKDIMTKMTAENEKEEHVLVCLSTSPSNAKSIRTAACLAQAFKGTFTALFVETPDFQYMVEEDKQRLRSNIRLAKQQGARIETVFG